MPRLIDKDALLEQMKHRKDYVGRPSDPVCLVEDAPTVGGWISVKDRLPEVNHPVLWWCIIMHRGMGHVRMGQFEGIVNHDVTCVSCCGPACNPLYWMPLPEPPKEEI